jgi:hypothetical protein
MLKSKQVTAQHVALELLKDFTVRRFVSKMVEKGVLTKISNLLSSPSSSSSILIPSLKLLHHIITDDFLGKPTEVAIPALVLQLRKLAVQGMQQADMCQVQGLLIAMFRSISLTPVSQDTIQKEGGVELLVQL